MKKFYSVFFTFIIILAGTSFFPTAKVSAAECGGPVPPAPKNVKAVSGPQSGQVTLYWDEAAYANRYAVAYGTTSGKYIYGADNIGRASSRSYSVKALQPGVRYYFKLAAARDCSSSGFSMEVSAVAGGGVAVTTVPVGAPQVMQPVSRAVTPGQMWAGSGPIGKQKLIAMSGPAMGTVTLRWQHADSADNYHLVYGTMPGKYQYGALNIGNVTKFTVRYLAAGKKYYFALVPLMGERPLYTTPEVAATAWLPVQVEVVNTTPEALIQPQPVVTAPVVETPVEENKDESANPPGVMGVSDEQSNKQSDEQNVAF